ncbi:GTP 3',8-cyclase MoaA [Pigmentiphaga aceris]|uniref:GTP 3',8-cyclase MoaA n=1 Tax=Pigmentiphaga aceris TaxID=1940612 RepID=UPI003CCC63AC
MTDRIIPLVDARSLHGKLPAPARPPVPGEVLLDRRARALRDLRISVTDRCNFRCVYCMPKEVFDKDYAYLPHGSLLSFEEIARLSTVFAQHGTEKLRLTGGEPLLRRQVESLIELLAKIRTPAGKPLDLTLTTNASLLARKARGLAAAGLNRVTVSLDALDDKVFRAMNDVDFPVSEVLRGIDAAAEAGLGPVKVNMVVKRGVNDDQVLPMARYFRGSGHILRFIEYMDVGASNGWNLNEVVPSRTLIEQLSEIAPLVPVAAAYSGEVAERWRYTDGSGEIGVISSVTQAFCGTCTRARLSTDGKLYLCLFADQGYDLKTLLRNGADDTTLATAMAGIWQQRNDNYSERRSADTQRANKIEMSYIGG